MNNGQEILQAKRHEISHIIDRVGTGDAFMGGLIYGLLNLEEPSALEFAVGAACLKHTIMGDANLVSIEEVWDLLES